MGKVIPFIVDPIERLLTMEVQALTIAKNLRDSFTDEQVEAIRQELEGEGGEDESEAGKL